MKVKISEIMELCRKALLKRGMSKKETDLIVAEYLDAELRGRACHGLAAFPRFAVKITGKKIEPKVLKESGSFSLVDGNGGMGMLVFNEFLPQAIKKAKAGGIAMLGVKNAHSYLMPGTIARKAAEQDVIALLCNYGGRARVAPTGSIDPVFGTNPIAIAVPSKGKPIVLDMATSEQAMLKVRLALQLGERLPEGVALDKNGNPTNDPAEAFDGALLPFGGYKGSGLALMVEILSRCLLDVHEKDAGVYRGYLLVLIDPRAFTELDRFKQNVEDLKSQVKNSRKAKGVSEIYLPGEHSDALLEENAARSFVELDAKILDEIKRCG